MKEDSERTYCEETSIFPLSPDPSLYKDEAQKVYFSFLNSALNGTEAKRINNIAISGGFGTGKSSLIRSYDQFKYKNEHTVNDDTQHDKDAPIMSRFLYVSVGKYPSNNEAKRKQLDSENPEDGSQKQVNELTTVSAIERRVLLQIFSRFRKADLPQSSFKLIPELWENRLWWISIFVGTLVLATSLLCFHEPLGKLFVAVNNMEGGPRWGGFIMGFLVKYKTLFRLLLCAYCIIFGAIASVLLCFHILPYIRFHAFSVKGMNTDFSIERDTAESYLDLYCMELVYCLEKLAEKIDHVVVFEDLDRLDSGDCLYILTRLREINNLVNLRLQRKSEHLCFIYAVNDDFLRTVQHEKFFDYILPVIPKMNRRSAAVIFSAKINKIDEKYDVLNTFPQFETVASCLDDYRLQNTILNEYQVLERLYLLHKPNKNTGIEDNTEVQIQKNEILAFAIYKNCWPGDYNAIRDNNSRIFTNEGVRCPKRLKNGKYGKLLEVLASPENHLLTLHSLYFVNFDEKKLADMYSMHWKAAIKDSRRHKEIIAELDTIQKDEAECISVLQKVFNSPSCFYTTECNTALFRAVLKCVVRCDQKDNSWFFDQNQYNTCIKLLAGLNSKEDEILKTSFFNLSHEKIGNKNNFYGASVTAINGFGIYTNDELKELCRGIKHIPPSAHIEGLEPGPPETSQPIIEIRELFKSSQSTQYFYSE